MAKCTKLYAGNDSQGRYTQVAQDANGEWWYRYTFVGFYGSQLSKWTQIDAPEFVKSVVNQYTGEKSDIEEGLAIEWGFKKLYLLNTTQGVRLPK